jgi:hypothetical protein
VAVFNRSETGLSGLRPARATQDIGSTYDGSLPSYTVLVNGDFLTSRVSRRNSVVVCHRWGYDVNFGMRVRRRSHRPIARTKSNVPTSPTANNCWKRWPTSTSLPFNTSFFLQVRAASRAAISADPAPPTRGDLRSAHRRRLRVLPPAI